VWLWCDAFFLQRDEAVVECMRSILVEKQYAQQQQNQASEPSASTLNDNSVEPQAQQEQRNKPKKPTDSTTNKKKSSGDEADIDMVAIQREIAELEAEESAPKDGADPSREKKLSQEARAHDLKIWEDIVRTALLLQKAARPIHQYWRSLIYFMMKAILLLSPRFVFLHLDT